MSFGTLPKDPARRRILLVVSDHEVERLDYDDQGSTLLLHEQTHVLPYPNQHADDPIEARLAAMALLAPGVVLVQSPFDPDDYAPLGDAPLDFARAKHFIFSELCSLLGARRVEITQVDIRMSKEVVTFRGDAMRLGAGGKVSAEREAWELLKSRMTLNDVFPGGKPNIQAADALLRRTRLLGDPNMATLLRMRANPDNPISSRDFTLSLSSEAKSNLKLAAELKVPGFLNASAEFKRAQESKTDFTLTIHVDF